MSIFCSLVREDCNIFHSQSTVKTLESASQLPYRHMWRRLSYFPRVRSTRKRFGLSSLWKIWICPNFRMGQPIPQIKEYVLEHTGLKVSNLYISQIKRKCGIEVGKNYNLPKSEDSRQPQCPPEKEKAIREAFKYFGMI